MSDNKKIFFAMFHSDKDVKACVPVAQALKKKYPDHTLVFATSPQNAALLVGVDGIDEIVQPNHPAEMLLMGYTGGYDKVYIPMISNSEQANWQFESRWISAAPNNTLSDYYAHRCLDDIVLTDRNAIPVCEEKDVQRP